MNKRLAAGVALIVAGLCGAAYAFWPVVPPRDPDRIEWHDDFLGGRLRPDYTAPRAHERFAFVESGAAGGWLHLTATSWDRMARLRLGDDPTDTGNASHNMPFVHAAEPTATTRVLLSDNNNLDATIGFVGPDDPNGVSGALIYRDGQGGNDRGWMLQTCRDGDCKTTLLRNADGYVFVHGPSVPFTVRIEMMPGRAQACAESVGDQFCASNSANVPEGGSAWEYQVWGHHGATPSMMIDYLNITQRRS